MKRILLLEDDQNLGETIYERLLESAYSVVWAKTVATALQSYTENRFDLVIIDVNLPDGDGFTLAKKLHEIRIAPFLFMTARTTANDRLMAYEVGAQEFVPKPFHFKELLIKIRHVLQDHVVNQNLEFNDLTLDVPTLTLKVGSINHSLTTTEASLLRLLIEKSPQTVSRNQIIDEVWGEAHATNTRTIDNMISKIRSLIGEGRAAWLQSVRGVGYRLNSIDQPSETQIEDEAHV
jgi:DNA-binding response OmpR family regulator